MKTENATHRISILKTTDVGAIQNTPTLSLLVSLRKTDIKFMNGFNIDWITRISGFISKTTAVTT